MVATTGRTALVLGATGGLGLEIARALLARGWRVRALVRDPALAGPRMMRRGLDPRAIEMLRGDALHPLAVLHAAEGCAAVIHAAKPEGFADMEALIAASPARSLTLRCGDVFGPGIVASWLSHVVTGDPAAPRAVRDFSAPGVGHPRAGGRPFNAGRFCRRRRRPRAQFEGATDLDAVPLIVGRVAWAGVTLELDGTEARLDLSPIEGFGFGPAIRYRGGRGDDVDSRAVARLDEIDDAVEIGGFLRYGQPLRLTSADEGVLRLDVLGDASGVHSGVVATLTAAYAFRPMDRLGVTVAASTRLVSDDYAETYSGVTAAGAAASGLAPFEASGGLRDVGISVVATYEVTESWSVLGIVSVSQLLGDAADSPIVDREGSATQVFGGLALTYSF